MEKQELMELKDNNRNVNNELQEYEESSLKEVTNRKIRFVLWFVITVFGLFIISLLLNIANTIRSFNQVFGYISLGLSFVLFIIFYVKPIYEFMHIEHFVSSKDIKNAKLAAEKNNIVRKNIAIRIINMHRDVKSVNWYDSDIVSKLEIDVKNNDKVSIKNDLTALMNSSIKKASDRLIVNSAVQSGVYAAVSPSAQLDALLVAVVNFKMIRDIIFLYGFRPSEPELIKIFIRVMFGSLAAYTIDVTKIGALITTRLASKSIPFVKDITGFVTDAVIQAITNGTITMWVGYKTIAYLSKEYNLFNVFEQIDVLDDTKELEDTKKEIMDQITEKVPFIKDKMREMNGEKASKEYEKKEKQREKELKKNGIVLVAPITSYYGKTFIEVQKNFLQMGFKVENIRLVYNAEDRSKGLFERDGVVIKILINGSEDIAEGQSVPYDSKVDIVYNSFL